MDNFKGLLGARRVDKVPNARIRELRGVKKGVDERIDEEVLWWFGHVERIETARIAKTVGCHSYMKPLKGGSPSVGEPTI